MRHAKSLVASLLLLAAAGPAFGAARIFIVTDMEGVSGVNNGMPYCPAIAALSKHGVNYVAASTSKPSDSFPGLTAIITANVFVGGLGHWMTYLPKSGPQKAYFDGK